MAAVAGLLEAASRASPHVLAAVAGAVAAGATRHVAAAVTAAAIRTLLRPEDSCSTSEVDARLEAVRPVLNEYVSAAAEGRQPRVSGVARLRRNVAVHAGFGEGPEVVQEDAPRLRRRQRGRRAAGAGPEVEGTFKTDGYLLGKSHHDKSSTAPRHETQRETSSVVRERDKSTEYVNDEKSYINKHTEYVNDEKSNAKIGPQHYELESGGSKMDVNLEHQKHQNNLENKLQQTINKAVQSASKEMNTYDWYEWDQHDFKEAAQEGLIGWGKNQRADDGYEWGQHTDKWHEWHMSTASLHDTDSLHSNLSARYDADNFQCSISCRAARHWNTRRDRVRRLLPVGCT